MGKQQKNQGVGSLDALLCPHSHYAHSVGRDG